MRRSSLSLMDLATVSIRWLLLMAPVAAVTTPFDEWAHQRVTLANVSIALRCHGTGPPLLLVHGYPEHSVRNQPFSYFFEVFP